jgi:putative oxidoreductase
MRSALTLGRAVLGGYIAIHGAQKLFGAMDGPGLDATGTGFHNMGLRPGRQFAALAGGSELVGGVLTATGAAEPLGPILIMGTMSVATAVHRKNGPMAAKGGYELALTNLAFATVLLAAGRGHIRLSPKLSKRLTALVVLGGAGIAGFSLAKLLNHQPEPAPVPAADEPVAEPAAAS